MSKIGDIFYLILGIALLILGITGKGEVSAIGFIAAAICIYYGIKAIVRMVQEKQALKSEALQNPAVQQFYRNTKTQWEQGRLNALSKKFAKEGKKPVESLIGSYRPYASSALEVMFRQFVPEADEFLIGIGNEEKTHGGGWFVLTNQRLIQKDGASLEYKSLRLGEIDSFQFSGAWTKKLQFKMKNGETVEFSKVSMYPNEAWLEKLKSGELASMAK